MNSENMAEVEDDDRQVTMSNFCVFEFCVSIAVFILFFLGNSCCVSAIAHVKLWSCLEAFVKTSSSENHEYKVTYLTIN